VQAVPRGPARGAPADRRRGGARPRGVSGASAPDRRPGAQRRGRHV